MKNRIINIVYLIIMAFYIFRPVLPYIEYALNHEYIATHLCIYKNVPGNACQGKCHIHTALEKNAENEKQDQSNNKNNTQNTKTDDFIVALNNLTPPLVECENLISDIVVEAIINFAYHVFIPPKF